MYIPDSLKVAGGIVAAGALFTGGLHDDSNNGPTVGDTGCFQGQDDGPVKRLAGTHGGISKSACAAAGGTSFFDGNAWDNSLNRKHWWQI